MILSTQIPKKQNRLALGAAQPWWAAQLFIQSSDYTPCGGPQPQLEPIDEERECPLPFRNELVGQVQA